MESIRIETTEHPLFAQLWKLYNDSFPRVERRTLEHQKTALRSELYSLLAYTDEGKFVGLVGYWEFDSYVYIEHLCVDPSLRSGGYGSRIMKHLCGSTDKTVILEIEPVVDEPTARRFRFYEKLGFRTNPYRHTQHLYHEDDPRGFMLTVLSCPGTITQPQYDRFDRDLRSIVMKRD